MGPKAEFSSLCSGVQIFVPSVDRLGSARWRDSGREGDLHEIRRQQVGKDVASVGQDGEQVASFLHDPNSLESPAEMLFSCCQKSSSPGLTSLNGVATP